MGLQTSRCDDEHCLVWESLQPWCACSRTSSRAVLEAVIPPLQEYPRLASATAAGLMTHGCLICRDNPFCLEPYYNINPTVATHRHLGIEAQHLSYYSRGINFPKVLRDTGVINLFASVWAVKFFWTLKAGFFWLLNKHLESAWKCYEHAQGYSHILHQNLNGRG